MSKLIVTLEVIDKGSKVLKKFYAGTKSGVKSTMSGFKRLGSAAVTLGRKLRAMTNKTAKGFSSLKSMIIGTVAVAAAAKIGKSFIDAASTAEGYQIRLNALLGSVEEGNRLFRDMVTFAGQVPFEYQKIMGAATMLAGVLKGGVDEIKQYMPLIADLAAASGLSIEETTAQVIRMYSAGAASADLFRERGILAMLGFTAGVRYSVEDTRKIMFEAWNKTGSKFKGVTKELAKTWVGLTSMLVDKWVIFQDAVMKDGGVFDFLKGRMTLINQLIDDYKSGGGFQVLANDIGDFVVDKMIQFNNLIWDVIDGWDATKKAISGTIATVQNFWTAIQPLIKWLKWLATGAGQLAAKTAQIAGSVYGRYKAGLALFGGEGDSKAGDYTGPRTDPFAGGDSVPSYAKGTGAGGLPRTGLFMGHKGEIVKNPSESRSERRGGGGNTYNVTFAPNIMTGDRASLARAWSELMNYQKSMGI